MKCSACGNNFEYFAGELEIYKKFDAKTPDKCPFCRRARHLIFRNEKNLFYNKSCLSGKKVISLYPQSTPFKIVDQDEWWSDKFDATIYARDFDFNKPFFEQYKELQREVPRWSRIFVNCENSDFTNNCAQIKNSYLTFSSYESEDLYYCMRVFRSNTMVDCLNVSDSQYCSQCSDCKRCYNVHFSLLSEHCSDSYYLFDCKNCKNCILSSRLRNKEYFILNKQYSKEEYEKLREEFIAKLFKDKSQINAQFKEIIKNTPHKNLNMLNAQNSLGNFINDSKNIFNGFYILDSEDCSNVYDSTYLKNCYDNSYNEKSELCLEIDTSYELYNSKFCTYTISLKGCAYCDQCDHLTDCFGCIGLKRKNYNILNKQYSKEEYLAMMERIKNHMKDTGEWGMPFPGTLTPFPYNTTLAYEYYPLSKEEALKQGFMWHDDEEKNPTSEKYANDVLTCENTGKGYKIILQELAFYKKFKLPIPRISPEQRYKGLLRLQPPKRLVDIKCASCDQEIKTVYPKESGFKVICEKCYGADI